MAHALSSANVKAGLRRVAAAVYQRSGAFRAHLRGKVAILAYHRVLTRDELDAGFVEPGMYVTAEAFERQMQFLREHFRILPLGDLFRLWRDGGLDPQATSCAVTFDDGWLDNYRHAYPVLRRLGVPATIFLPTRFVGTDDWFWPDRLASLTARGPAAGSARTGDLIASWKAWSPERIEAALAEMSAATGTPLPRERAVVNWDEVAEMARHGISFGSHSSSHAILTTVSGAALRPEIDDSLAVVRERSGNCVPVFCYPNGNYSDEVVRRVEAAGYVGAVTMDAGCETAAPRDLFRVRRIPVHHDVSRTTSLFAFHISGLSRVLAASR